MMLSHKIEIKPNSEQIIIFERYINFSRYIYNLGLEIWNKKYLRYTKTNDKSKLPNGRKVRDIIKKNPKKEWYKDLSPNVLDTSIEDLEQAFNMFFKNVNKHPKFKSKKSSSQSFRIYRKNNSTIRICGNKLYIPKLKTGIRLTEDLRYSGTIKTVTISKKADKWFASFTVDTSIDCLTSKSLSCGIDLGLKSFAVIANDNEIKMFNYPSKIKALYAKRDYLNKQLSRKIKGSNKYNVTRTKLQRCYLKISNIQNDFLHKLTKWLVDNHNIICIEDLNIQGMLKLRTLSGKVYQSLFYHFREILTYKSKMYNSKLVIADRWFPSTQTCSSCGYIREKYEKLSLNDRIHACPSCNVEIDRDENAALNLRYYGLKNN